MKRLLLILLPVIASAQYQIGMYYQSWTYGERGEDSYIQNMNLQGLTYISHIEGDGATNVNLSTSPYYGLAVSSGDSVNFFHGKNGPTSPVHSIPDSLIAAAHAVGAKALLTLGCGYDQNAASVVGDSTKTQAMVDAVCYYVETLGYDGIELDWEDPNKTLTEMSRLVRRLRAGLDAIGEGKWLTSAQAHWDADVFPSWMEDYFTYFGIQTYDLTANNENVVGYNAPLLPPESPESLNYWQDSWAGWWESPDYYNDGEARGGPRLWIAQGWSANKLICGVSQAGYLYIRNSGSGNIVPGVTSQTSCEQRHQADQNSIRQALLYGGTRTWDATSKVPWINGQASQTFGEAYAGYVEEDQYFYYTYDDSQSVYEKVQTVKDSGYAGVFLYDAGIDWDGTDYLDIARHVITAFANETPAATTKRWYLRKR